MEGKELSISELSSIKPGEGITLTAIMAILAIAIIAVVCYRMFRASSGSAKVPGGWSFTWK